MTRSIRILGALLSIAVTAVGIMWWTTPASYPFGAADRVTVSLTHLLEHDVTGPMTVAAGLVGLAVIVGPGPLVRAGAVAELLFFGVVLSDAGIMSVAAYGVAILGPVALLGVVVVAAVRGKWSWRPCAGSGPDWWASPRWPSWRWRTRSPGSVR
ncbi:hypothetical protein WBK31_23520 [Nonomuraea sp. N2-4H]|jgi:hypothetical protein|uniref:hypothetical protein n=1 Tax=unclassified Nonomuraea TaxID=2593643 RepID=UPI003244E7F0